MGKTALALISAFGLGALAWALATLQGVFIEERDDALAALSARRSLLEDYAARALREELAARLAEAREPIAAARHDPLAPATGYFLAVAGRQVLPRVWEPLPREETPARLLYEHLLANRLDSIPAEPGSPWAERLALHRAFRAALRDGEAERIETGFRDILRHRSRFVVPVERDLPYVLALLEAFQAEARPSELLMAMVLREGLAVGSTELPALQPTLLRDRHRFGRDDFAFLADRIDLVSERAGVAFADFSARVSEAPGEPLGFPTQRAQVFADPTRGWYVESAGEGRAMGVRLDLAALLGGVGERMKARGLTTGDAELLLGDASGIVPISGLEVRLRSPDWSAREVEISRLFRLKTALVLSFAGLALTVAILGSILYRRGQRLAQLRSEFVATVSHELRTPLASIRVQAETLERRAADLPGLRNYPARIIADIDRLSLLVENILSFNRLERGSWDPIRSVQSLAEILDELRRGLSRVNDVEVRLSDPSLGGCSLEADPDLVQLLLLNLARNSCKYSRRNPVEIEIGVRNGHVLYRDNGSGIAPEMWEAVFDDFVRAPCGAATRGVGLGLSICRRVAQAHLGHIDITRSDASGTTFEIDFGPGSLSGAS
ncbi:MAG: HAMP domain-containing sensor histidine kinase [Myxococcota bacterium]|nr:HAMP domain-containing sensor histidine kinase [Myxococcota bacterium]